jgi:HSP20 family molecular chaperone IbpA
MTLLARRDLTDEALTTSNFAPPVDIYEDEHNFALKIEVPGIDERDINVSIANNRLTVRVERMYGTFTRSFTLPNTADPEQVSADYEKGVLNIRLAKKAGSETEVDQSERRKDTGSQDPRQGGVIRVACVDVRGE